MLRWIRRLLVLLLLLALAAVLLAWWLLRASLPTLDGELAPAQAGLEAPATIQRDAQGTVTIDAASEADALRALGAAEVIDRAELSSPGRPLGKERWAGAVDSVGSHTLANACAGTRYRGAVTACGLAQGMDFPSSVAPFILRGVTLAGVDSVMAPYVRRAKAWERLARELPAEALAANTETIAQIKTDTAEMLGVFESWKGAMKVMEMIGKLAKPLGYIVGLGASMAAFWAAMKSGINPK